MIGSFLRKLSTFQRIALVLAVLAAVTLAVQFFLGSPRLGDHFKNFIATLLLFAFATLIRRSKLFFKVRNRLLLSYFLFGVVPVLLIGMMAIFASELLLGRIAADRVRQELDRRTETVRAAARDIALTPSPAVPGLVDQLRREIPGLSAMIRDGDRVVSIPADARLPWSDPTFKAGLYDDGSGRYLAAQVLGGQHDVFAYIPLDNQTLATFTPGVSVISIASGDLDLNVNIGNGSGPKGQRLVRVGFAATIYQTQDKGAKVESVPSAPLPSPRAFWDTRIGWLLQWPVKASSGRTDEVAFVLESRPSLLLAALGHGPAEFYFFAALTLLSIVFLVMELGSLIWSFRITRTITRSVHELHEGTRQIAAGNLAHRTPLRGHDQLSELAGSFNGMTEQIQKLIVEVREKEKLESELEIAREVQIQLFPKSVPKLKTLELAGMCIPSRFVSGDYYDFIPLDDRWIALGLGDISGKGISAALLMASVQSALHAQLKFAGSGTSTATLMGQLSQQLYENTPAAKYATFFCSVYDDQTGTLVYTNAGHLPPILVRGGKASPLIGDGMVVGLFPKVSYDQQTIQLEPGDLLAVFSDGIPEAEDAAADQFGDDRLSELLIQNAGKPLDEIIRIVTDQVTAWTHDPETRDDATILLARRK